MDFSVFMFSSRVHEKNKNKLFSVPIRCVGGGKEVIFHLII